MLDTNKVVVVVVVVVARKGYGSIAHEAKPKGLRVNSP